MKLRQIPEDFMVEEIGNFEIKKEDGKYRLYIMEKKSIESFALFAFLRGKYKIHFHEFGIGGLKDKHAVTRQHVTVPAKYVIPDLKKKNFTFTFIGFINKPLKYGEHMHNKFVITVRDIGKKELDGICERAKYLEHGSVPNYFDSQRFGSAINSKFIIRSVMKKDYEEAVKLYLTQYTRHENRKIKDEKQRIAEQWDNIIFLFREVNNKRFKRIIEEYKKTGDWLKSYNQIPKILREMFVSAYQSYLWNECVKELLLRKVGKDNLESVKYNVGNLLFPKSIAKLAEPEKNTLASIDGLKKPFHLISLELKAEGEEKEIISKILGREGLIIKDFDIKKQTGTLFRSAEREILVRPNDFKISQPTNDELNHKKCKMTASFSLPPGSYATIITKYVFRQ